MVNKTPFNLWELLKVDDLGLDGPESLFRVLV